MSSLLEEDESMLGHRTGHVLSRETRMISLLYMCGEKWLGHQHSREMQISEDRALNV